MKKLFNFRPLFSFVLFFAAGIMLALTSKTSPALFLPLLIATSALMLICIALAIIKKSQKSLSAVLCCVFLFTGLFVFLADVGKHERAYINTEGYIEGTVTDKVNEKLLTYEFYMRGVTLTAEGATYSLSGYTRVSISKDALPRELAAGDNIGFFGRVTAAEIFTDGKIYTKYYKNDVKYIAESDAGEVILNAGNPLLSEIVRTSVKDNLYEHAGKENGSVLYALLFGDKTDMDADTYAAFSGSGIIHLFAVSGLHVGFLGAMLIWALNKLKIRRVPAFLIQAAIFAAYTILCGFAPSVMRAALMALIMQLSNLVYRRYDILSSMSLSALIILAFRPLLLFDAGFLFTYACMFGIVTLTPLFEKGLVRLPKFLRKSLSMSLAAQIALLPLSAYFFGEISLFAALFNIFAMPAVIAAFYILLPSAFLCLIFNFLGVLIAIPGFAVSALRYAGEVIVSSGIATLMISSFSLLALGFYLILYIMRFMLVRRDRKAAVCVLLALLFLASTLIINIVPQKSDLFGKNSVTVIQSGDNSATIVSAEENRLYLVLTGGNKDVLDTLSIVAEEYMITEFDALILTEVSLASASMTEAVLIEYGAAKIILPFFADADPLDTAYYLQIEGLGTETVFADTGGINFLSLEGLTLSYVSGDRALALCLRLADINIAFFNSLTESELSFALTFLPSEPYLIVTSQNFERILEHFHNALVICGNRMYNYFNGAFTDSFAAARTVFVREGKFQEGKKFIK